MLENMTNEELVRNIHEFKFACGFCNNSPKMRDHLVAQIKIMDEELERRMRNSNP